MQIIILAGGAEFSAASIFGEKNGLRDVLSVTFGEGVSLGDALAAFDADSPAYDRAALERIEIYGEDGKLQGVHRGYTKALEIAKRGGAICAKLMQDDGVEEAIGDLRAQADSQRSEREAEHMGTSLALAELGALAASTNLRPLPSVHRTNAPAPVLHISSRQTMKTSLVIDKLITLMHHHDWEGKLCLKFSFTRTKRQRASFRVHKRAGRQV